MDSSIEKKIRYGPNTNYDQDGLAIDWIFINILLISNGSFAKAISTNDKIS